MSRCQHCGWVDVRKMPNVNAILLRFKVSAFTARQVAAFLGISIANASNLCHRMESMGLSRKMGTHPGSSGRGGIEHLYCLRPRGGRMVIR